MSQPANDAQVLRVGVTGHRILTDLPMIYKGLDAALDRVREAYPGRSLSLLTSLAEGADRIVAEAVLRTAGGTVVAVIPFSLDDYATDFGPEGSPSRIHLDALLARSQEVVQLPRADTRDAGYAQGGRYVLEHCDVLLTIWDGEWAQGQGGTGEIVAAARERSKPVVIVRAGNRKPGTSMPTSLGAEQGRVLLERLP